MNCSQSEELFAAYVDGLLDETITGHLEVHLADCAVCRTALDETRRLISRLERDGRGAAGCSVIPLVMDRIVQAQAMQLKRHVTIKHIAKIVVAAAILAGAGIAILQLVSASRGGNAYANDLAAAGRHLKEAETATWKMTFYRRRTREDSPEQSRFNDLIEHQLRTYAYKAPGLYRDVTTDEEGEVVSIDIQDTIHLQRLLIIPKEMKATRFHPTELMNDRRGPFAWVMEELRSEDLKWLGKKKIGAREANGFRHSFWFERQNRRLSYDFWVDAETKKLASYRVPGIDILDPDRIYNQPTLGPGLGHVAYDISFGVDLDDSLFSFELPAGYTIEDVGGAPDITEKDVIEFMGIVAEYFENTFPDQMPHFNSAPEYDRFERVERMPKEQRTPAEDRLVEVVHRWKSTWISGPGPMYLFIHRHITPGSWKYVGSGVKLGDQTRIVCWFRLKGSKTYRVVYGDLSVKDAAPGDIPLPVER